MDRVYLDYAASAPLAPEAKTVIERFLADFSVGNPSSLHAEGRHAQSLLDRAHTTIAAVLGVSPTEVVLTSGATESNNLAIGGALRAWRRENRTKPHVVMSSLEHSSWRDAALAEDADVTIVPASKDGVVSAEAICAAITDQTALVGCMYVQNEIGTVQPVGEIGKSIHQLRQRQGDIKWPVFHVDAVQAWPFVNCHSGHIRADAITLSGHKYGALGGVGVLIIKKNTPIDKLNRGGGQEWGHRAGTENILGALTLARMLEWGEAHGTELSEHVSGLQRLLEREVARQIPEVKIVGRNAVRAPHITYMWLPDVVDEHVVHRLDLAGFAVSSGSACSSGAQLPSATLIALGYDTPSAYGGLRVSYGRGTKAHEIELFIDALVRCMVRV